MAIFTEKDNLEFQAFTDGVEAVIADVNGYAQEDDIRGLKKIIDNFNIKTNDFYRENRKLNIGVVGQVKAGKSSFLNTLLFEGREILPKAATPKTATLTKMEYSERNIIHIEYYSPDEWETLEHNAQVDSDEEIYTSAAEIVAMMKKNGLDPYPYLEKGIEEKEFDSYDDLINGLNDFVGENGKFTPIVKAVILYINKEEFKGLSIVDTPGLNDPILSRTVRTKEFMEICDVVFFLSQSGSFLDKSDWELLSSQLPQKGVKRLVLIASKYDSGIRDILRVPDPDDVFGDDDNTADNIPKACKIIRKKLKKRAKSKVVEFVADLEARGSSAELIDIIKQCSDPIMVSSLVYNMTGKPESEYDSEERNIFYALKQFSDDIESDMKLLGNFDEVKGLFDDIVQEKEAILEQKAKGFVPTAREEMIVLLTSYLEKTNKRVQVLENNDREELLAQKQLIENQIGNIKADIATVFGDLNVKLETEKAHGIRELRDEGKNYLDIKERSGSITKTGHYTTGHLFWKKHHEYTYEEHYSYCLASDAIDQLRKFSLEACNQVEEVFTEGLQLKELKRNLFTVIVDNFDMGDENYDSSLFRVMVEEIVSAIEFPIFDIDISSAMDSITGKFTGELTSAEDKNNLTKALSKAVSNIYNELCGILDSTAQKYKKDIADISKKIENDLLSNINAEFESLISQCENKEKQISDYKIYSELLQKHLNEFRN